MTRPDDLTDATEERRSAPQLPWGEGAVTVAIYFTSNAPFEALQTCLPSVRANVELVQRYPEILDGCDLIEVPLSGSWAIGEPRPVPFGQLIIRKA